MRLLKRVFKRAHLIKWDVILTARVHGNIGPIKVKNHLHDVPYTVLRYVRRASHSIVRDKHVIFEMYKHNSDPELPHYLVKHFNTLHRWTHQEIVRRRSLTLNSAE